MVKLHSLKIEGFRRHLSSVVEFSDATFLIGENNMGKSSVFAALDYLLGDTKKIPLEEYYCVCDANGHSEIVDKIVLTAEFRNLPRESLKWRGFKGRVLRYDVPEGSNDTGLRIVYRKIFSPDKNVEIALLQHERVLRPEFEDCATLGALLEAGLDSAVLEREFGDLDLSTTLNATRRKTLMEIDEALDYDDQTEVVWFENPGGIAGNILHRLPRFLLIPAQDSSDELDGGSGALKTTLEELFKDVRDASTNYREAQRYLNLLAMEMDPANEDGDFGKMMGELNTVLNEVFPESGIHAETQLNDAEKAIKPQFNITMSSNIATPIKLQGTGMVRSAVFALLRYRNMRENRKVQGGETEVLRPLLICFEEPEIYLHPNAADMMRDTLYDLAASGSSQIVCTTHSPYMIDLSRKPSQTLNYFTLEPDITGDRSTETIAIRAFNTTMAFQELQESDQQYVKMLLKMDDQMARVFFAKNTLIVEGDTEEIVFRETIDRLPEMERRLVRRDWQIVRARGKGTIISLVYYLKALGITPVVMHDLDIGVPGAERFNEPIRKAVDDGDRIFPLKNCIEDVLGYSPPQRDKPSAAFKHITENWGNDWDGVPEEWRSIVEDIFCDAFQFARGKPGLGETAAGVDTTRS